MTPREPEHERIVDSGLEKVIFIFIFHLIFCLFEPGHSADQGNENSLSPLIVARCHGLSVRCIIYGWYFFNLLPRANMINAHRNLESASHHDLLDHASSFPPRSCEPKDIGTWRKRDSTCLESRKGTDKKGDKTGGAKRVGEGRAALPHGT